MRQLLTDLERWQKVVEELPPLPKGIRTNHSVPLGRIFRQWDTKGRLWVWCNPGDIFDLPFGKPTFDPDALLDPAVIGISIYHD